MHSPEWQLSRLGKFTASMAHCFMGERGIGDGGITYVRSRIGEELTGISSMKEVDTDAMRWGLMHEPFAIQEFGKLKGVDFLVTQKLIADTSTRFGATPDCMWVKKESEDKLKYDVCTGEVKCYPTYANHIACALCETPQQIKKEDKQAYWQVIMQMDECDCLVGYLVYYHPDFKAGSLRVIEFRKIELIAEFKLLKERQKQLLEMFEREREMLMNIKN